MRTFFSWVLLIILIVAGAYLGSPWWAVWNLEQAAKAGDAHAVAGAVDLPAVRASLSPQLAARLQRSMDHEKTKPHSLIEKLILFVRPVFQPKAADSLLTPSGVTYMLKTAQPPPWGDLFQVQKAPPPGQPSLDLMLSGYVADDLDQFHATVDNKLLSGRAVSLKLLRRGFVTWKVVGLDLVSVPAATTASGSQTPGNSTRR
jgi:hypothetical protein